MLCGSFAPIAGKIKGRTSLLRPHLFEGHCFSILRSDHRNPNSVGTTALAIDFDRKRPHALQLRLQFAWAVVLAVAAISPSRPFDQPRLASAAFMGVLGAIVALWVLAQIRDPKFSIDQYQSRAMTWAAVVLGTGVAAGLTLRGWDHLLSASPRKAAFLCGIPALGAMFGFSLAYEIWMRWRERR